ncbi:hypothetical protein QTP88_004203 [Uroleucon formosanum]
MEDFVRHNNENGEDIDRAITLYHTGSNGQERCGTNTPFVDTTFDGKRGLCTKTSLCNKSAARVRVIPSGRASKLDSHLKRPLEIATGVRNAIQTGHITTTESGLRYET